jgi:MerR family transcriptional regulator/heat shock protein HspR
MTGRREQNARGYSVVVAAERTGLSSRTVRRYVRVGLVEVPLTDARLAELRRIRRLTELGINLAGVEVILHMRGRIESLQADVARLRAALGSSEESR